jgi:hypothetical protein
VAPDGCSTHALLDSEVGQYRCGAPRTFENIRKMREALVTIMREAAFYRYLRFTLVTIMRVAAFYRYILFTLVTIMREAAFSIYYSLSRWRPERARLGRVLGSSTASPPPMRVVNHTIPRADGGVHGGAWDQVRDGCGHAPRLGQAVLDIAPSCVLKIAQMRPSLPATCGNARVSQPSGGTAGGPARLTGPTLAGWRSCSLGMMTWTSGLARLPC